MFHWKIRFSAFACWSNESEEKLKMDWLIQVTNRLKVNRKETKRAGRSEEGRKGCGGSFRVKNWANSHVWETEDKKRGSWDISFRLTIWTLSAPTMITETGVQLFYCCLGLGFGRICKCASSPTFCFLIMLGSTLSNHTVLTQYIIPY